MRGNAAVWLLAIGQTFIYAGCYYAFPALLPDLEVATGWSKATLAAGPTLAFLVMAVATPLSGRLVDRGLGGELLIYGPVLAAAGIALLGLVTQPWQWLAIWAGIGLAQSGCFYETCFAFLTRRLGAGARAAITRVTLVAGLSSTMTFPLGHYLGRALGGQGALLAFAALMVLIAVPVDAVAVRQLRRMERAGFSHPAPEPQALRVALGRVEFWVIALMFGLITLNHGILITFVLVMFQDRGVGPATAALAAACIGPAQVVGRLVLMVNERRVGSLRATMLALAFIMLAAALLLAAGAAPALVFAVALAQGAGMGLVSILRPVIIAEVLGRRGFGAISGAVAIAPILASAAAPSLGAFLMDRVGMGSVYWTCLGLAGLSLACAVGLARRAV